MTRTVIIPERRIPIDGASDTMCFTRDDKGYEIAFCPQDHRGPYGHFCKAGMWNTIEGVRGQECLDMEVKSE